VPLVARKKRVTRIFENIDMGLLLLLIVAASAKTFFSEKFENGLGSGWVQSEFKPAAERGELVASEKGVTTQPDARFFQYSHTFPKFSNVSLSKLSCFFFSFFAGAFTDAPLCCLHLPARVRAAARKPAVGRGRRAASERFFFFCCVSRRHVRVLIERVGLTVGFAEGTRPGVSVLAQLPRGHGLRRRLLEAAAVWL
jgi:hypothetical protein